MTPRGRFLTAMDCGIPDIVPVGLSITGDNMMDWFGENSWQTCFRLHKELGVAFEYGLDYNDINKAFKARLDAGWSDETHIEFMFDDKRPVRIKTRIIKTPKGELRCVERSDSLADVFGQLVEPLIKGPRDYETYLLFLEQWLKTAEIDEDAKSQVDHMGEVIGDDGVRIDTTTLTFYRYFWVLRRVEDLLRDFIDEPDLMKDVLKITSRINQLAFAYFLENKADAIMINCSGASSSVIGPEFFRRWVLPELQWFAEHKKPGKCVGYHTTGKMKSVLPLFIEGGADWVLRFESSAYGGDCSLADAKAIIGDKKVCVYGGYDPHIYLTHDKELITYEARRLIDEAKTGGGFIIGNTDHIPVGVKIEDIKIAVDFINEYGQY